MHYVSELKSEFGAYQKKCKLCSKDVKTGSFISHMGQVHDEVRKYYLHNDWVSHRSTNICQREPKSQEKFRKIAKDQIEGEQYLPLKGNPIQVSNFYPHDAGSQLGTSLMSLLVLISRGSSIEVFKFNER